MRKTRKNNNLEPRFDNCRNGNGSRGELWVNGGGLAGDWQDSSGRTSGDINAAVASGFVGADAAVVENFLPFGRDSVFRRRAIDCRGDLLDQAVGQQAIQLPALFGFKFCPDRRAISTIADMPSSLGV